jgi:hypothetical protein
VHGAFAPDNLRSSEEASIDGRIKKYQNRKEPPRDPFVLRCIDEFATLIVGSAILEPFDFETIEEKQQTPTQRLTFRRATVAGNIRKRVLKCFGKAEAYPDIKDQRNISTYNDLDKLEMSSFTLALSSYLKKFRWYGPGMTPREISARLVDMLLRADFANVSDYERMDGTITELLRLVERSVLMKAFKNHRSHLNELLKNNVNNYGILPHGTTFNQGQTHGSGCPGTSVFQTLRAAFTTYLAFRHTRNSSGEYYSPKEAFDAIGIHLGDDGVDADLPAESHQWAAKKVGLILEASIVERGQRGVNFLARYYSEDIWTGNPNSMCDVKRQLAKFHTTVRLPNGVSPEQKLVEKAMSFVATDGNTPVIGEYCKRVLLLSDFKPKRLLGIGNYWSRFEESAQYPNRNDGGWMDQEFSTLFEEFDRSIFDEWMATANTVEKLLCAPLCAEPKPATPGVHPVVVDEDILPAKVVEETKPSNVNLPEPTTKPRAEKPPRCKSLKSQRKPRANWQPRGRTLVRRTKAPEC